MTVTHVTVDLDRLNRRYQGLQLRLAGLQGQAKELAARQGKLTKDISIAKARIDMAPLVAEAFTYLQDKAHSRAVGEFEDLLSAFVSDVVPEAGSIHLELGTERGAPSLDIQLDNHGKREGILDGNGGGLTNVVVTGLVYAAQARTSNRPLVVLDEPDCWLKATRVPSFTKVIAEVANPRTMPDGTEGGGCQTLMISHNDIALVDEGAHIIELRPSLPGRPEVISVSGAKAWDSDSQVGVRWIEVENLRAHANTRVELSPGLNVLAGDINLGKSTVFVTALRALAYGETDDTMIRHESEDEPTPFMAVRAGLEDGVVVEVIRNRKASPKVVYRLYKDGVVLHEGRQETRGGVPGFITAALKIERVDGLDIQLRSQKQPVFLLDETAARRAQLLSVGKESGLLQAIIEKHRTQLRRDKDQLKRDEIELNLVNRTLKALSPVAGMTALVALLTSLMEDAQASSKQLAATRALVAKITPLSVKYRLAAQHSAALGLSLESPVCKDTKALQSLIARMGLHQNTAQLRDMPEAPGVPELKPNGALQKLTQQLERGQHAALLAGRLQPAPLTPKTADTSGLRRDGVTLATRQEAVKNLEKEEKDLGLEAKAAEEALHAFKHELGVCPACNQSFKEDAHV